MPIVGRALAVPAGLALFHGLAHPWLNGQVLDQIGTTESFDLAEVCVSTDSALAEGRAALTNAGVCRDFWLIDTSFALSVALVVGTLLHLVLVATLARMGRPLGAALVRAFRIGWAVTPPVALAKAALEAALLTYASFEITALATQSYFPKLILVVAIGGAMAFYGAARALLARIPLETSEQFVTALSRAEAPALWATVDAVAREVGTDPPDHILIAENTSFYVTEFVVHHGGGQTSGKTLVLSRPLMVELGTDELRAIVAHELAHFSGGDTLLTRELYPRFARATMMAGALAASLTGFSPRQLLDFLHRCFVPLLREQDRLRELAADRVGADVASPTAAGNALVRVHVLSEPVGARWRAAMAARGGGAEGEAAFAQAMQRPLVDVAQSALFDPSNFWPGLFAQSTPHPLGTHPPLSVRLAALGVPIDAGRATDLVTASVPERASGLLSEAGEALARTSAELEARVAQVADHGALAARVTNADVRTPEGRALLEQHFPEVVWPVREGQVVAFAGLLGVIAAGCPSMAAVLYDVPPAMGLLGVAGTGLGLWARSVWVGHHGALLTLACDGVRVATWDRPLLFADIERFSWKVHNEAVTLTAHLSSPAPPFHPRAWLRHPKAQVVIPLAHRGPSVPIANTILRYYQRGLGDS